MTDRVDPALALPLAAKGVVVTGQPSGGLLATVLSWVAPVFIFYLLWVWLFRSAGGLGSGGLLSVG